MSETEARLAVCETRVGNMEAFLELRYGYRVTIGQNIIDQRKHKEQLHVEARKIREREEKIPPKLRILSIKSDPYGDRFIRFHMLTARIKPDNTVEYQLPSVSESARISLELEKRLGEGKISDLFLVKTTGSPSRLLAHKSELKGLEDTYNVRIAETVPMEIEFADEKASRLS
jgi:hypothetical protein